MEASFISTVVIIIIFTVYIYITYSNHWKKAWIPSHLTGVGILGTFVGICIGLFLFDSSDIQGSVPKLLDSLKISFITSIVGMFFALRAKRNQEISLEQKSQFDSDILTPEIFSGLLQDFKRDIGESKEQLISLNKSLSGEADSSIYSQITKVRTDVRDSLNEVIQSINTNILPSVEHTSLSLDKISKAISDSDDNSITGQITKLRADIVDSNKTLKEEIQLHKVAVLEELDKIVKKILESNNDVLVQALQQTIKDFNEKLTEQFGENFKHLNAAVEKLVLWQEQYRKHIEELTDLYDKGLQGIESSEESLKTISKHQNEFLATHEKVAQIINNFSEKTLALEEQFGNLADITSKAKEVFPVLENNLGNLTEKMNENIDKTIKQTDELIQEQNKLNTKIQDSFSELLLSTEKYTKEFSRDVKDEYSKLTRDLTNELTQTFAKSSEQVENQINALDEALEKELKNSLNSLGKQLASLSGKFVEDYTPLTENLRDIVRIAKGVNHVG